MGKMNTFDKIQGRLNILTKPQGSLGALESIVLKLGVIQKTPNPKVNRKRILVFAADHGITAENVSAYPASVTCQMVLNFARGGAAINVLTKKYGVDLKVVDVGVNGKFSRKTPIVHKKIRPGTRNFLYEDAMTETEMKTAIRVGKELARQAKNQGINLLGVGDMGIGNTTAASAITAALLRKPAAEVTSRGTGLNDVQLRHKIAVIKKSLKARKVNHRKPLEILRKVGGYEIAAIAGVALGCAQGRIPLVTDGFITTAGVALAAAVDDGVRDIIFASHVSEERGHRYLLEYLEAKPFIDLEMRLGEGTGTALAMDVIDAGVVLYEGMATFTSAGVDDKL